MRRLNFNFILIFLFFLVMYIFPAAFAPYDYNFYESLNKPFLTPPSYVFSIVWTVLFILMSISAAIVLTTPSNEHKNTYVVILFLNYLFIQLFSYFQFDLKNITLALLDIILVLLTTLLLITVTKKINKVAAYLLVPLLIWVIYAAFLQTGLLKLNTMLT